MLYGVLRRSRAEGGSQLSSSLGSRLADAWINVNRMLLSAFSMLSQVRDNDNDAPVTSQTSSELFRASDMEQS